MITERRNMMDKTANEILNQWQSVMKVSRTVEHRVAEGVRAMEVRGYDVSKAKALLPAGEDAFQKGDAWKLQKIIAMIREELRKAPRILCDYSKPNTWEELKNSWTAGRQKFAYASAESNNDYFDKVYGSWYGKAIGVALGDPLAGWPSKKVRETHGKIESYYLQKPDTKNDDINYQILVLHAIDNYGVDFTSRDLGYEWVEHLPLDRTFTAERIALENLIRGITPPYSAMENNPFVDWIGAQMRGEVHGLIAPGKPEVAADYAYRDARISHLNEGIYGEVYNAVMISLAFVLNRPESLVKEALHYVPQNSEFYGVVYSTLQRCKQAKNWEEVLDWINETYGHLHWIHTFPNIAIVVMSLIFGEGDFSESIRICASCGWDCDCTTGQVGATVGTMIGEKKIPAAWKEPMTGYLETEVRGYEKLKLSELAKWTCRIGELIEREGKK